MRIFNTPIAFAKSVRHGTIPILSLEAGDILILMIVIVAKSAINTSWLFSSFENFDPWYNLGYGLNYTDPQFLRDYYKSARVVWIAVQFVARSLFDPLTASWMIQISTLGLAAISLYLLFDRLLGRTGAFFGAILFVGNSFVFANGGADYHNTLAGPLFALTWWLAIRAAQRGAGPLDMIATGAAFAAMMHTNIIFVNLMPFVAVQFWMNYRHALRRHPPIFAGAFWIVIGAILCTAALGGINRLAGRDALFFLNLFKMAASFVADSTQQKGWWKPWSTGWWWNARYLGPLLGGIIVALLALFVLGLQRPPYDFRDRNIIALILSFLASAVLWIFWQSVGQTALDYPFFAFPLAFTLTGMLAAIFAKWSPVAPDSANAWPAKCLVASATLLPWLSNDSILTSAYGANEPLLLIPIIMACAFIMIFVSRNVWLAAIPVLLLSSGFLLGDDEVERSLRDGCHADAHFFKTIDRSHRLLRSLGQPHARVHIWADADEPVTLAQGCHFPKNTIETRQFVQPLIATGFSWLSPWWDARSIPEIKDEHIKPLGASGALVVYVTNHPGNLPIMRQRLERAGLVIGAVTSTEMGAGAFRITLHAFDIRKN